MCRTVVKTIIKTKKKLLQNLEENIFHEFTGEEDMLLHSKHGYISIRNNNGTIEGITGAFKVGLPLSIDLSDHAYTVPTIRKIDWNENIIEDSDQEVYNFEFRPIKLSEL